ncbi:MAG TPA: hypothetical protein VG318_03190 [Actinomycetota bacterium]|nr:hypothetical protein [Actinomycetota bacterium]
MEALQSHPDVRAGFEELGSRRGEGAAAQLEFARSFFVGKGAEGAAAVGFKTKLQDVLDPDAFTHVLRECGAYVLLLQRRNVVKAVVSWFRSELVNRATGDWNVYRAGDVPPPIEIDTAEFVDRIGRYEEARRRLQQYALELERPTLMLYYEDLLADESSMLASVCGFLGVGAVPLKGGTVKATPDDLRAAVANLDELRDAAGSRYRPMFEAAPAPGL